MLFLKKTCSLGSYCAQVQMEASSDWGSGKVGGEERGNFPDFADP